MILTQNAELSTAHYAELPEDILLRGDAVLAEAANDLDIIFNCKSLGESSESDPAT